MNIPQKLPVSPLQSKAARYQLGLTQANIIEESGLPGHKLKQFETGRLIPDMKFLEALASYYHGKGIELSELKDGDGLMPVAAAAVAPKPSAQMVQPVMQMAFRIAPNLSPEHVDKALEKMDAGDERVAAILKEPATAGLFSDHDERTDAILRELFGVMAANYLAFRFLQGRSLVAPKPTDDGKRTIADLLGQWIAGSPIASLAAAEAPEADAATETEGEE
jgi:transcriptional regulator with XRE-family HTH domain